MGSTLELQTGARTVGGVTRWLRVLLGVGLVGVLAVISGNLLGVGEADSRRAGAAEARPMTPLVMQSYVNAATRVPALAPDCAGMSWHILAGIGAVESAHAGGRVLAANGDITPPVIGPRLDGSGVGGNVTPFPDTDAGVLDGDLEYDRAVGPMQFLPETWQRWGRDGNDDGTSDPHNIFDATLGAAAYLCGTLPVDLTDRAQLTDAITRYNRSPSYVADVLAFADSYAAATP